MGMVSGPRLVAASIFWVSLGRYFAPQNQSAPAITIKTATPPSATFMFQRSRTAPINGGEITSPRRWMMRIFKANALARTIGKVTLASAVLEGPVGQKRKKTAKEIINQSIGKRT